MGNFYEDNKDSAATIDALDLTEVASLLEENFRFAEEFDFAPKDAASAIDNYKRALSLCGDICANRIAPTAEETDKVGNILNDDGTTSFLPNRNIFLAALVVAVILSAFLLFLQKKRLPDHYN